MSDPERSAMIRLTESARKLITAECDSLESFGDCVPGLVDTMKNPADISTYRIFPCGWAIEDINEMIKEEVDGRRLMIPPEIFELLQTTEADISADGIGLVVHSPKHPNAIIERFYRKESK